MRHTKYNIRNAKNEPRVTSHESRTKAGSALILAVVLTSLLAIVGVMFVMVARVNRIATSAIAENRELNFAVETVVAEISRELVLDVPNEPDQEYYDYPDAKNAWLASLEPYKDGGYKWRQISDVTGFLEDEHWETQDIEITSDAIIDDHEKIELDADGNLKEQLADADGDGVADSKWIKLDNITTSKGKPIYAAIRIVDNGGMLNVNTAYEFDANETDATLIDGSSQMQINLMALSWRPGTTTYDPCDETDLLRARANYGFGGVNPLDLDEYEENVVWRYNEPNGPYTPFDISDELELRYRFLVNQEDIDTRLEEWGGEFRKNTFRTPAETGDLGEWFISTYDSGVLDPNYAYRHFATTYNMDRIIDPAGGKMLNVNTADKTPIRDTIRTALLANDPNFVDVNEVAAQIAVNLIDFRDGRYSVDYDPNDNVTTIDVNGTTYYGFERPCIYISELAHIFIPPNPPVDANTYRSYAIELYKPYFEDRDPNNWQLVIDDNPITIDWSLGSRRFYVIRWLDPNDPSKAPLDVFFDPNDDPNDPNLGYDPSVYAGLPYDSPNYDYHFDANSTIYLKRRVDDVNYIVVDYKRVPDANAGWLDIDGSAHSIQRDITTHKCIRRLWADTSEVDSPTLGQHNSFIWPESPDVYIQAHPANKGFTNVGEVGMIFRKPAYYEVGQDPYLLGVIGYGSDTEEEVRIDLADPNFQQLFKYLTVFDPADDNINNDGDDWTDESTLNQTPEWKVPGRININTAPWYVIAQLPWVSDELAQAIVAYRDEWFVSGGPDYRGRAGEPGFESIGELMLVNEMRSLGSDGKDNWNGDTPKGPDLTEDTAQDDFEERDVIFARISNLVTVRSDVFTAYILVRIGADGPQKRVIAVFDRSDVYSADGKVKVRALHPVPDPR